MSSQKKIPLTRQQVVHIAKLSELKLTEKEIEKFRRQLSEILDYVRQLNELDTDKVEPTSQVTGLENVFREDETEASLTQVKTLSNASDNKNNYFKVKAIFEEK